METQQQKSLATFGGGCFWCIEALFKTVKGVSKVTSGYSGGHTLNPTYDDLKLRKTGHAEVIQVEFNPKVVSFSTLLKAFFSSHDPTSAKKKGKAEGNQYRSIILYHDSHQKEVAEKMIADFNSHKYRRKNIATELRLWRNSTQLRITTRIIMRRILGIKALL